MIREYIYFVDDNPNGTSGMTEEEIIRCKDCIHARPFLERYHCDKLDEDWEISFEANHYCSYAERMESDTE